MGPWAVGAGELETVQHRVALPGAERVGGQRPVGVVAAGLETQQALGQLAHVVDVARTGGGEVAQVREVRPLAVVDALDELRDQEVDVRVALAVGVRRPVDRDALEERQEVRPVIEVVPAQEELVRLARTRMLGDDEPGDRLEHLAWPQQRARGQPFSAHIPLAAGVGGSQELLALADHDGHVLPTSLLLRRGRHRLLEPEGRDGQEREDE